jgi:hypothetical protein
MRRIRLSLATLVGLGTVACAAACSSSPTGPSTSGSPQTAQSPGSGASSPGSSAGTPAVSRTLSLVGDGHALHLSAAPADPSYSATYPISGFRAMTVTTNAVGDLTAACETGGGAAACKSLPFFTQVGAEDVKVFDPYGHVVLAVPLPPGLPPFDAGIPLPPVTPGFDAGGLGLGAFDAGGCAPSVTASLASCSLTIGGVTCDCSDASCASNAITACLSSAGVPIGAGAGGGLGGGLFPDAGALGSGWLSDAGPFGAACSSTEVMSDKTQFCIDVDAWLTAHGISMTLDCAKVGTLTFPSTLPAPSTTGFTCDQITHDAFVKVRAALATCNPLDYVGWDSSAELQLFEGSACDVW